MSTYLDESLWQALCPNTFIFDLEYVGNTTAHRDCYIWEIGVVHWLTGAELCVTIDPKIRPLPAPFSVDFAQLTEKTLKERHAVDFHTAWHILTTFIDSFLIESHNVLLVAHNCFKADKPVLEAATRREGIHLPLNWFFFDSLLFCRAMLPKQTSYALKDIFETTMQASLQNAHSALPDARALRDILMHINPYSLSGTICPAYTTPLQSIKWLGASCENYLFMKNVRSIEQLMSLLINSYATHNLLGGTDDSHTFVKNYLTVNFDIKDGNAKSIATSIVHKWLPLKYESI